MPNIDIFERVKRAAASIHAAQINELCSLDANGLILEIGTGSGHLYDRLAGAGLRVVGLDLCAMPRPGQGSLVTADAQHLPFASARFSAVICCHSLEHIPNLGSGLSEITRVIRPSGRLIVIYPYEPMRGITLMGNLSTWPEFWKIHRHKFVPRSLTQLLLSHRFRHLSSRMYLGYIPMYISCFSKCYGD